MHAATADEVGAAPALARELSRLRGEPVHALVTTSSAHPAIPALSRGAILQLAPGDTQGSVNRFLDHWRPDLGLVLGLPDRPNLIAAAGTRGIPLFLAAAERGTISQRRRLSYLPASLLTYFRICFAASAADAEVLERHLEKSVPVEIAGPFCDTTHPPGCYEAERDTLAQLLGGRPVWLAADVTDAEVPAMEKAHRKAFRAAHRLLLILVPRNPDSGAEAARLFDAEGWQVARRSLGEEPDRDVQVYVADTEDELGLWYRLAPMAFMGGTFDRDAVPTDPYDAATLGSAVLHGPALGPAPSRFLRLGKAGATVSVQSPETLGEEVQTLLAPDKTATLAEAAWSVTTESAHVVARLAEQMDLALDGIEEAR